VTKKRTKHKTQKTNTTVQNYKSTDISHASSSDIPPRGIIFWSRWLVVRLWHVIFREHIPTINAYLFAAVVVARTVV
jgi:hypothetical protein